MSMQPLPPTLPMGPVPPTVLLTLVHMERQFRRILNRIYALFRLMIRALKSGHPRKYVLALIAMREMNIHTSLTIDTLCSHIPRVHIPFAP